MNNDRNQPAQTPHSSDRMVLLVPSEAVPVDGRRGMSLAEMWNVLWRGKWLIIGVTAAFAILSVAYALLATQWFRAEAVVIPARMDRSLLANAGGLAGLASLAGVRIGEDSHNAEALGVLRSRGFIRAFIEEQNLMPVLFHDEWDAGRGRWKDSDPDEHPDARDGVRFFENRVLRIAENKKTGLITLSVEWTDRKATAEWANLLVSRVNARMRERAQVEAERNLKFLREELRATNVVTLQQSISRLLENELEKLMLARSTTEFAFRVVDRAVVPKWRSRPKRTLLVILATMAGGMVGVLAVFGRHALRRHRPRPEGGMASPTP